MSFLLYLIAISIASVDVNGAKLSNADPKLLQVIGVIRHGVRANNNKIPALKDCSLNSIPGEVTKKGHQQNYDLGVEISQTYPEIFSNGFNIYNHRFIANFEDKNLISAPVVFQGIFKDQWTAEAPYPSVPVHSESKSIDYVMSFDTICSEQIAFQRKNITETEEFKNLAAANTNFFNEVKDAGGFDSAITLANVPVAAEQIILATGNGLTAPGDNCVFTNSLMNEKLIDLATKRVMMNNNPNNRELAKLQASPFWNAVLDHITKRITCNATAEAKAENFVLYTGSNANVLGPLQLMNQPSPGRVPFCSLFFFEVYVTNPSKTAGPYAETDIGVKIGYRVFDDKKLTDYDKPEDWDLTSEACEGPYCTIDEIRKMAYTMDEWKQACKLTTPKTEDPTEDPTLTKDTNEVEPEPLSPVAIIITAVLGALLVAAIVVVVVLIFRNKVLSSRLTVASRNNDGMSMQMKGESTNAE